MAYHTLGYCDTQNPTPAPQKPLHRTSGTTSAAFLSLVTDFARLVTPLLLK